MMCWGRFTLRTQWTPLAAAFSRCIVYTSVDFQSQIPEEQWKTAFERMEKKVRKEGMDLTDFLSAMRQIQKLGPLEGLLKMLPGVNAKMLKQVNADPKRMRHVEAIVLSMTPQERKQPGIINGSRRARIAKGCGRPVNEVNRLLDQLRDMQKMMKKAAAGGGRMPRMF